MALTRSTAATLTVQLNGATAPVSGSIIGGAALGTAPARVGTTDFYTLTLTAAEMDASSLTLRLIDAVGEEYGVTIVTDEEASDGSKTLAYRVLLDTNGDGVADSPAVGVPGVTCVLTSDLAGDTQVGSAKVTDAQGYATWKGLVAGTYYVWREHPAFSGANPDTEVVS